MVFFIVCLLVGCGLGLRFKVLVLIPVTTLAVAFAVAGRVAGGDAFWWALMAVAATVSLQIGYLIGLGVRYLVVGAYANRLPGNSLPGTSPARQSAH